MPTATEEGHPTTLMEAMAMEKPVIAFLIEGILQIIEDDVTGLSVKRRTMDDLTSVILTLSKDRELARKFRQLGRKRSKIILIRK